MLFFEKVYSVVIIKPDMVKHGLIDELESKIEQMDLKIIRRGEISMDLELVKKLYQWPILRHPVELEEYLCRTPLQVWFIEGRNAVESILKIKGEIRKKYCTDQLHTLLHCPDSNEDAQRECNLIWLNMNNKKEIKTNNQVEVIVFKKAKKETFLFLILKRVPARGGFWQPITGNVREEESFEDAALRELREETGIVDVVELIDTEYLFEFFDDNRQQTEKVFGAEVPAGARINISSEHTEYKWMTSEVALSRYLKYLGNKEGLKRLVAKLETREE
ncbi:NUDIX domain-containing protein [Patescibacteria group bacterium]|nr:NUDIX domain-containing protein [Patescibacteria group bacterium]